MMKILIVFLLLSPPVWAQSTSSISTDDSQTKKSKLDLQWPALMGGMNFSEGQDDAQLVQLALRPKGTFKLADSLTIKGEVWLSLNSERSQSRFFNPGFNPLNLMELKATYKPHELFSLSAGAINQKHFSNRMFIADRAFPGLLLRSGYQSKNLSVHLKGQYAIPTSTSFESDRTQAEALPSLVSGGVELKAKVFKWLRFDSNMNYFEFSELPSIVAFNSGRLGNQVVGINPSESQFAYDFKGYSLAHKVSFRYFPKIRHNLYISILDNLEAPEDRRRSQYLGTSFDLRFKNFIATPSYAQFFAESDSTPAFYSAFELGRNNREGELFGLKFNFKKKGFSVSTNYIKSDLLNASSIQRDMSFIELVLEVHDVSF